MTLDVRALALHLRPFASDLRTGLALLHPRARFAAMIALRILAARMIAALRIVGAGAVGPREGRAERGEDGRRHQQSRKEERLVGKEWVRRGRSRGGPSHIKKKKK